MQHSIVLIVPYFGKLPIWFDLYLHTCKYNSSIQWLFYSDCKPPAKLPDNVRFNWITFADYKKHVSTRLGINFTPDSPYKLCDIKPALGLVHQDDIRDYEYWGFCDIDLFWGDLEGFLEKIAYQRYEIVSTHARRVSGHFCIMRNTEKMLTAFKQVRDWTEIYASARHVAFDEKNFSKIFIKNKNLPQVVRRFLIQFNPYARKGYFVEHYTTPNAGLVWRDQSFDFPTEWYWQEGKIWNNLDQEFYPYFHFFEWKLLWKGKDEQFKKLKTDLNTHKKWRINCDGIEI